MEQVLQKAKIGENKPILSQSTLHRTILISGAVLTFIAVIFHLVFLWHAGPFWRDECNSIALAAMPSLSDTVHSLRYDSFPILLSVVLRPWVWLTGDNDFIIRLFGFAVGVTLLGVLWFNSRVFGCHAPLLSIALFAFNPIAFQFTDSIRPYGLGLVLMLLTFGLVWKVTQQARPWQVAAAAIAAILSVQCLYQNAFFIVAVITGAILVTLHDKQWKRAGMLMIIAIASAISLLPYLPVIKESGEWTVIFTRSVNFTRIWNELSTAIYISRWLRLEFWIALFAFALFLCFCFQICRSSLLISKEQRRMTLFCIITIIVYTILFILFLRYVCFSARVWYDLPLLAIAALFMDIAICHLKLLHFLRIGLAILVVGSTWTASWTAVHQRQTNMDLALSTLEKQISADDSIFINPWFLGVSFHRYYDGPASFITFPPVEDCRIHRFDLVKAKLASAEPIKQLLIEIERTLKSGNSFYIVGDLIALPPIDSAPQLLPPAPHGGVGWNANFYAGNWMNYVHWFIQSHALTQKVLFSPAKEGLNPYESVYVVEIRGWR